MKTIRPVLAALLALLVCAPGCAAGAADMEYTTEVSIQFAESIRFDRPEAGGMDVDFGVQPLPMPGTGALIAAPDGAHAVRVSDGRVNAGNWSVSAKYTGVLSGGGESFISGLYLFDPTWTEGLTPNLQGPNASAPFPPELRYVNFDTNEVKLFEAASGLAQGSYELACAPGNVRLYISAVQVAAVQSNTYTSTVVWTLTTKP